MREPAGSVTAATDADLRPLTVAGWQLSDVPLADAWCGPASPLPPRHPDAVALLALRRAVARGDTAPTTWLNLAVAEDRCGDPACALELLEALGRRTPHWDEPPVRAAQILRTTGQIAAAQAAYLRALAINPDRVDALLGLGALLLGAGAGSAALPLARRSCGLEPERAEAWDLFGLALLAGDEIDAAETAFAEAARLAPDRIDYGLHRVEAARRAGTEAAALARLAEAGARDPLDLAALAARGVLLERLGRRDDAIDALEIAYTLAPDTLPVAGLLGGILARSNRLAEAEGALRRAARLQPDNPAIRNDLGAVLMRLQRHAEAAEELRAACRLNATAIGALCNLATAINALGKQTDAIALARQAVALAPEQMLPRRTLANLLPYAADARAAAVCAALADCARVLPRDPAHRFANAPDPDRRLRIGLLSGSLRAHPVGWLTVAGFESLDRARFDLVCLVQAAGSDAIARRFRACAGAWEPVDALDDAALADRSRALGIDVLIDLGGYGDRGRLPACARRLAPVQIKWVGMQTHSTWLPEIDWMITDQWETPPSLAHLYSERLLRLPEGYVCYSPPSYAPDVGPSPALLDQQVTFGCFNNLAKLTPVVITTWARVLNAVPGSRLVMKTHQFGDAATCAELTAAFAAAGVAAARVELRGASGHREFLRQYNDIDLLLDPFPYSGGLTTCEALWMGVPTLTLPGETFASRHSASHMSNVGLADWLATDIDDYIAQAVRRAGDHAALAALRAGLRARVKASPLCDARRFGDGLGAALRTAWHDWCVRQNESG